GLLEQRQSGAAYVAFHVQNYTARDVPAGSSVLNGYEQRLRAGIAAHREGKRHAVARGTPEPPGDCVRRANFRHSYRTELVADVRSRTVSTCASRSSNKRIRSS